MENQEEVIRVRIPKKDQNEILGVIEQMLGASRVRVRCVDGKVRMGRIPGKLKRKIWIKEGDVVIVSLLYPNLPLQLSRDPTHPNLSIYTSNPYPTGSKHLLYYT